MTAPLPTLAFLAYHWGDAYLISYAKDRWVALRRDTRYFLVADSLAELEKLITADYRRQPVSRDFDPLQDADYLTFRGILAVPGEDDSLDADEGLDAETLIIVQELRRAFPAWTITLQQADADLGRANAQENHQRYLGCRAVYRACSDRAPSPASQRRT